MTEAAALFAVLAILMVAWSYLAYPGVVSGLAGRATPRPTPEEISAPSTEVVLSAFDEEDAIGDRVRNLLAQDYPGALSVAVGCDGCTDATAARAEEAGGERIRVVQFPDRRGKAAVVNDLVSSSRADVVVFTDANTDFDHDAVSRLVAPFADRAVGAVCGRLDLVPSGTDGATPETEFWNLENDLKDAEGRLGVCLGANGAIYAARRSLVKPLPEGTVLDDFLIAARIVGDGHRVVYARDAVARELLPPDVKTEVSRRFRIGIGAGRVLRHETWLWDVRRRPLVALVFFSRKAARWLAPVAACLAVVLGLFSAALRPFAIAGAALVVGLALSLALRRKTSARAGRLYYFGVINLALAAGVVAGLAGYRRPAWPRTVR